MPTPVSGGPPHTVPSSRLQVARDVGTCSSGCLPLGEGWLFFLTEERGHVGLDACETSSPEASPRAGRPLPAEAPSPLEGWEFSPLVFLLLAPLGSWAPQKERVGVQRAPFDTGLGEIKDTLGN